MLVSCIKDKHTHELKKRQIPSFSFLDDGKYIYPKYNCESVTVSLCELIVYFVMLMLGGRLVYSFNRSQS